MLTHTLHTLLQPCPINSIHYVNTSPSRSHRGLILSIILSLQLVVNVGPTTRLMNVVTPSDLQCPDILQFIQSNNRSRDNHRELHLLSRVPLTSLTSHLEQHLTMAPHPCTLGLLLFPRFHTSTRGQLHLLSLSINPLIHATDGTRRQDHVHPSGSDDLGHSSRSLPAQSPTPFWPSDYSLSSMGTPAYTEGSADPAQSDQEEFDAHTSTSPTTSTSTSTSASSTASRWARFRVPQDIFTNPPDPARHELYHRIRQEPWFVNQHAERHLAPHEAERIPGSTPGESVLLAFYDRIVDHTNKAAMRCTICAQTNPGAQLYPRPDRAKVHMRHHFELRPIPCNRACKAPEWYVWIVPHGAPPVIRRSQSNFDQTAHNGSLLIAI